MELGSVAVVHFREPPSPESLQRLARDGIGLRRIEGFGSVQLNPQPWRRAGAPPAAPVPAEAGPSALAPLRDHGLLGAEQTVRWLVSRSRLVLVERERNPRYSAAPLFEERVAVFFDDARADVVAGLFASSRLATVIPLLEQELERITDGQTGGNP